MSFDKIHNKGQAQLFRHPQLEKFTKSPPWLIWCMYLPVLFGFPFYHSTLIQIETSQTFWVFMSGMFFWTLAEYGIHRFAFHYKPTTATGKKISYMFHGNHHHFPRDKERLFMPPVPSIIIASIFFGLFYLLSGKHAFAFFPGFMLGYLLYGSMHFAIHAYAPPFRWLKPLWRNHHLHHYKDEDKGFGVSTTLWDRIFGTMFDLKKEMEDKEKVKELMY